MAYHSGRLCRPRVGDQGEGAMNTDDRYTPSLLRVSSSSSSSSFCSTPPPPPPPSFLLLLFLLLLVLVLVLFLLLLFFLFFLLFFFYFAIKLRDFLKKKKRGDYDNFKKQRNLVQYKIRRSKRNFSRTLCQNQNNGATMWSAIRSLTG